MKYVNDSGDNGASLLYYAGKYYFSNPDINNNFEKSLYIFTVLKSIFPLSIEATLGNRYINEMKHNGILSIEPVNWVENVFFSKEINPKKTKTVNNISMPKNNTEYIIRIGVYNDLSEADETAGGYPELCP